MTDQTHNGGCGDGTARRTGSPLLPADPFWAPRYHFGMLLGVDDFESEQAYHRGKQRLHNAWLHGEGVVWGLGVELPEVDGRPGELRGEVRVLPGLALDAAGRELHLETAACVGLAAWYRVHREDAGMADAIREERDDGSILLDAHVVACFRACLARPVPAIAERCEGAGNDVAHSRARETVELRLVPGRAPERGGRYHRLRLLFGIERPRADDDGEPLDGDREVLDARAAAAARPEAERAGAFLDAFRRFAALDGIGTAPYSDPEHGDASLFPAPEDTCVPLGEVLDLRLERGPGDQVRFQGARVEPVPRRAHVATSTLQELLVGMLAAGGGGGAGGGGAEEGAAPAPEAPAADAGGPRIDPDSVEVRGERVEMVARPRVAPGSLSMEAFSVTCYDRNDGWHELEIARPPELHEDDHDRIVLHLRNAGRGSVVRVIARGTGPRPLMGLRGVPLAGARGGPPGTAHDGHDFVCMVKQPSTRRSR